ncbi:MAG TPA: RNA methyltransferase substrate-binding domain-containing protein, partial [Alphaproteobacteria bacterium]|nr:RNA methyltransferase substrate-binding domain-containing protein [Alphaproteobacteria bacterium]
MTPKPITSPSNQIIKDIKALEMRKRRKETNLFLVEGLRSVIEGVELGSTLKYIAYHTNIKDKDELKRCVSYCNDCGGYALEVNDLVLEKLSRKDNPQSVIGVFTQTFHKLEN